jgi:hypothetical protein
MPILRVSGLNISQPLGGLANRKPLQNLSEKRVTTKIREELRRIYGYSIEVTCVVSCINGVWKGRCKVSGQKYDFYVF